MREIKTKVYKFNELSDEAKERVQEYFGTHHTEIETDMLAEDFKYQLEEKHPYFINPKFQWSLSCCQGDGLSFSCEIDKEKFIKKYFSHLAKFKQEALFNMIYNFYSTGNPGRYCYAHEHDIDFEIEPCYDGKFKRLEKLLLEILEKARNIYLDVCQEFEKQGYEAYEYLYTGQYAKDTCDANEYEFTEEGEMI